MYIQVVLKTNPLRLCLECLAWCVLQSFFLFIFMCQHKAKGQLSKWSFVDYSVCELIRFSRSTF